MSAYLDLFGARQLRVVVWAEQGSAYLEIEPRSYRNFKRNAFYCFETALKAMSWFLPGMIARDSSS
jgi:hypothetical protein